MPVTVNLEWKNINAEIESTNGSDRVSSFSENYIVRGTTDDFVAIREGWAAAPNEKEGLFKRKASIAERASNSVWRVRVEYGASEPGSIGGQGGDEAPKYLTSIQTGGGTQHIDTSLSTVAELWDTSVYPDGGEYPGVIEPDADGNPRGLDIPAPTFTFSETHKFRSSKMTTEFKKRLAYGVRRMNSKTFRGFAPGEVLFVGANAQQEDSSDDTNWTVTYNFSVQPNQKNIVIGNITVPTKFGWDYLWKMIESKTNAKGKVIKRVVAVFVERIYQPLDFGELGI